VLLLVMGDLLLREEQPPREFLGKPWFIGQLLKGIIGYGQPAVHRCPMSSQDNQS
jgi:hypothetical protein